MLMGSAMRAYAPENDEGAEDLEDEILDDAEDDLDEEDPDLDAADEDDDGEEPEDEPEPRKPSRGENRVAAATRTASEAKRRADALEAELAEIKRNQGQTSQAELQRRRNEHLATLTGDARVDFLAQEQAQRTDHALAQVRFDTYDARDKAEFSALAAKSPAIRALEAEVEERLIEHRASGQNAPRANVLRWILGDKAIAKATRSNNKGEKRAAAGRERQITRPGSGRGDVAADRGRRSKDSNSLEALENRLRNQKI